MNNTEHDRQQALLRSAYIGITLLGFVLIYGAWLQSFDNIWWWLVFTVVLVVDVAIVLISRRMGVLINQSLLASSRDDQITRFFQAVQVLGGIWFLGLILFLGVVLGGFRDVQMWLALIAIVIYNFLVIRAYLRRRA